MMQDKSFWTEENSVDRVGDETSFMRVGKVVEWSLFEPELLAAIEKEAKGPGGRPRFHPLLMFKILVVQRLHGLADDDTSFQIIDRHSFRAFLGLTAADAVPDGQTIADYREELMSRACLCSNDRLHESTAAALHRL
jgi:hypothetical protein